MTTHYSRANTAFAHVQALRASEKDKFCIAIPMFHCFSLTAGVLSALAAGACVYFPADRHTETILKAISVDRCSVLNAVPTLFSALISRSDIGGYDFSSLRTGFIGGSGYTAEFFMKVADTMKFNLLPALGQTEATAGFTFTDMTLLRNKGKYGRAFMDHIDGEIREIGGINPFCGHGRGNLHPGLQCDAGLLCTARTDRFCADPDGRLRTGDLGNAG